MTVVSTAHNLLNCHAVIIPFEKKRECGLYTSGVFHQKVNATRCNILIVTPSNSSRHNLNNWNLIDFEEVPKCAKKNYASNH